MRVSKLTRSQRVEGRILVHLENGDLLRVGENEVVAFGLYAGMELDEPTLERLRRAAHAAAVRGKALDLIARRPMSRKELVDKLTARPRGGEGQPLATEEEAQAAADRLEELGYLNDESYARALVGRYAGKGYGAYKIKEELYRRGVPRQYWEAALEEAADPADEIDAFIEKKLRGVETPDRRDLKRVSDALARRGYSWTQISAALRRFGAETEE